MSADETVLKIGLSPEEVVAALKQMGEQTQKLAATMEEQLGRKGGQAVQDLKDKTEKGTNEITKFFSNMGQRIREDLKTAFDVSSVMAGANFAKQIQEGVKSVFDMERAFDRLGVRLGLTSGQMEDFKRTVGRATANAGVNVQDVQQGLMAAASAGIKDPKQLTQVAESLARSRQIDPSVGNGENITESIAEILRRQHIDVTGDNFSRTMDAVNAATATGNFRTSSEAASHIAAISAYSATNGLDTRQLAGLATLSSKGGPATQALLDQILNAGSTTGGANQVNATLQQEVFKNGRLDPAALARVNPNLYGQASILGEASGLNGANGGDLKVLIETFRDNMSAFNTVTQGTDETAKEFGRVSESWAAHIEQFKARLTATGREAGDAVAEYFDGLTSGDMKKKGAGLGHLASTVWDNKGDILTGAGLSIGAGLLMGQGVRGILGTKAAQAAGIQPVYVTNASEIKGDSLGTKLGEKLMSNGAINFGVDLIKGYGIELAKIGTAGVGSIAGMGVGATAMAGGMLAAAGGVGYGLGMGVNYLTGNEGQLGNMAYDYFNPDTNVKADRNPQQIADLMSIGMLKALQQHDASKGPPVYTNPSMVKGQGPKAGP